jgi:hypothetical protein
MPKLLSVFVASKNAVYEGLALIHTDFPIFNQNSQFGIQAVPYHVPTLHSTQLTYNFQKIPSLESGICCIMSKLFI